MFDNNKFVKILFTAFAAVGGAVLLFGIIGAVASGNYLLLMESAFGIIPLLIGVIPLAIIGKNRKAKKSLMEEGFKVNATITDVTVVVKTLP